MRCRWMGGKIWEGIDNQFLINNPHNPYYNILWFLGLSRNHRYLILTQVSSAFDQTVGVRWLHRKGACREEDPLE